MMLIHKYKNVQGALSQILKIFRGKKLAQLWISIRFTWDLVPFFRDYIVWFRSCFFFFILGL